MEVQLNLNKKELNHIQILTQALVVVRTKRHSLTLKEFGVIKDFSDCKKKKSLKVNVMKVFEGMFNEKEVKYLNYLNVFEKKGYYVFELILEDDAMTEEKAKIIENYIANNKKSEVEQ